MTQNIPLAICLGVVASLLFATGAHLQHRGIEKTFVAGDERHLGWSKIVAMFRDKIWWLGTVSILSGALLHLLGVNMAPVTVIQPVGILAVPFSVLLASRANKSRPTGGMWIAMALAVAGIVGFTFFSARSAATETVLDMKMILIASIVIWVAAAFFVGGGLKGPVGSRCLMWACSGAFLYGLATALMKTTLELFHQGRETPLMFWLSLAGMLACYGVGAWLIQQAYAAGPAEIVVGSMTVVDPLIAVAFGIVVLGEGRNIDTISAIGMVAMGALAAWGVALLSKYHPDATKSFDMAAGGAAHHATAGPGGSEKSQPEQKGTLG